VDAVANYVVSGGARKWSCRYCGSQKARSCARVKAHLLGIPNQGINICPNVPEAELAHLKALAASLDTIAALPPRPLAPSARFPSRETAPSVTSSRPSSSGGIAGLFARSTTPSPSPSPPPFRQASLAASWHPGRKAEVDDAVGRFFYSSAIPLNAVHNPYFPDMCEKIANFGPSYRHPSYELLRTKILDGQKKSIELALDLLKEEWRSYGVTLMGDGWSDTRSRSIQGILAYCRGKSVFLKSIDNSEGGKSAERLAEIWSNAIEQVGAKNVVQFVADGENSNRAAS